MDPSPWTTLMDYPKIDYPGLKIMFQMSIILMFLAVTVMKLRITSAVCSTYTVSRNYLVLAHSCLRLV